jgi:serine protease Do
MISLIRFRRLPILCIGIAMALFIVLSSSPSVALIPQDLDSMSSQMTVLIGQEYRKDDLFNPGSGVIVGQNDNTYYVVTNTHVVKQPREGKVWGVRTADGEVHWVVDKADNIIRFGNFESPQKPIGGFDLALVKFTSDRDYPIAVIGDSSQLQPNDSVFISGWPKPENNNPRRQRQFTQGNIAKIAMSPDADGGYNLMYSNWTRPGMSGSPVFNAEGELVGIHGQGRKQSEILYCVDPEINTDNSCGIQGIHLLNEIEASGIRLAFNPPPVNPAVITQGRQNRARADVIEDVYKIFTLGALRRDAGFGSGGCGSLLLGDKCPE